MSKIAVPAAESAFGAALRMAGLVFIGVCKQTNIIFSFSKAGFHLYSGWLIIDQGGADGKNRAIQKPWGTRPYDSDFNIHKNLLQCRSMEWMIAQGRCRVNLLL